MAKPIFEEVSTGHTADVTKGVISAGRNEDRSWAKRWLRVLIVLIVSMIVVGGLTRLTDSGLSITEWDPVMGSVPPLSNAAWEDALAAYRTTGEYQMQNKGMSLAEFKAIYWWEWGHRQLGRFIGVVWLVGFVGLWALGKIPKSRRRALFLIGPFIGLQGFIGWLMVASGLQETDLDVESYWLATHLGAAFLLLAYVYWNVEILGRSEADLIKSRRVGERGLEKLGTTLAVFVLVQILLGALVAGIDAGRNYTDWPLMAGGFLPPDLFALSPWWRNFFEDDGLVQFIHRMWAYGLFAFTIFVGVKAAKSAFKTTRKAYATVGLLITALMLLGIATVMNSAPWHLAIAHQFTAILLWLAVIRGRFRAGYPTGTSIGA